MLKMLKNLGYPIPEPENYDSVSKNKIFEMLQEFQQEKHDDEGLKDDFLEMLTYFPVSMCERRMTDNLKFLITIYYMFKIPQQTELSDREIPEYEIERLYHQNPHEIELYLLDKVQETMIKNNEIWYSYEQLAALFRRSKASIFDAIKEKETEVKAIVNELLMRKQAKRIALDQFIAEEKEKLKLNNQIIEGINQTTERT